MPIYVGHDLKCMVIYVISKCYSSYNAIFPISQGKAAATNCWEEHGAHKSVITIPTKTTGIYIYIYIYIYICVCVCVYVCVCV